MREPTIRLIRPEDRELVNAFFDQMAPDSRALFNRNDGNRRWAMRYFDGTDTQAMRRWVALDDDGMVGYVFLWDVDTMIPWLGIAVAERLRGQHFGRRLIAQAEAWCREQGKGGILLTTHMANVRAQALYTRCGFEQLGVHGQSNELLFLKRF